MFCVAKIKSTFGYIILDYLAEDNDNFSTMKRQRAEFLLTIIDAVSILLRYFVALKEKNNNVSLSNCGLNFIFYFFVFKNIFDN